MNPATKISLIMSTAVIVSLIWIGVFATIVMYPSLGLWECADGH